MNNQQHFPKELLMASVADRVNYFDRCKIEHRMLVDVSKLTEQALYGHASPKVILIAGPTGVGKTTLASTLANRVAQLYTGQMEEERDFVPIMKINAIAPNGSSFNWKDFYIRVLERAVEPLIERKVIVPQQRPPVSEWLSLR